jgi:hypothetical protein
LHAVNEILRADFLAKDDKNDQGVYLFGGKMGSSVQIGVRGHCLACGGLERACLAGFQGKLLLWGWQDLSPAFDGHEL